MIPRYRPLVLLCLCGSFCKLVHLARAAPPSLASDSLQLFDSDVRQCFKDCFVLDTSDLVIPLGSRYSSVYAMVVLACNLFLMADWEGGRPAVCDFTATSLLTPAFLINAGMNAGTAAAAASKSRKHIFSDHKCQELSWVCVPLAVETCGNWGRQAHITFSRLAS